MKSKARAILAGLSLLMLIGTVGGIDHGRIPLLIGMIVCVIFLIAFAWGSAPYRYDRNT